ncbi:hypothetical protein CLV78_101945 [Aliiruegeria haliotis]|uniref:Uncharacterized protein n=1 Tax=Aliiruegeria haliotis TaxID=1280846 RepID=A0A2T0S077_9RHOB|nr:hypothetical protein [Aliiruegeria haliotis]PRY26841.1 hypothetical protein CLV78_101945 [Aliiruegeria haliotis]
MKWLLFLLALIPAACGPQPDVRTNVTSRAAHESYACIAPKLNRLPVRYTTHRAPGGWRMDLQVFGGPPTGWYKKGSIEYSTGIVLYYPNSATMGIMTQEVQRDIRPILRRCSRG